MLSVFLDTVEGKSGKEGDDEPDEGHLQFLRNSISGAQATKTEEGRQKDCIVDTTWFNISVNLLTLCNTVQMGVEADRPDWSDAWAICENVFTAGFAMEMVIKLFVLRIRYFQDRANWLDGGLTCLGIVDCWLLSALGGGADLQSLSILRILRLMRLARILKLVRNFKPFVLVIQGVIQAISTTCYVFALLMLILYVFAIFCTQYLGKGDAEEYPGFSTIDSEIDEQEIMANYNPHICFGSIPLSMLTLFNMAMMAEWTEIVRPVALRQPHLVVVFIAFALLVAFSVMNVMIGSIVDSVFVESKKLDEAFKDEVKQKKLANLERVQQLLVDMDTNADGQVDVSELTEAMKNSVVLNDLIHNINLPCGWSSNELLDMLDNSGDGMLQKAEFTTSFYRLMESDDFQQICIMQASINQVKHAIRANSMFARDKFARVEAQLDSIQSALALARESEVPAMQESIPEKAASEPCSEPVGEQHCHGSFKEILNVSGITQDELSQCADAVCTELRQRIQCISHKQLTETLDAIQESFQKEIGTMKPTLEPKLITSGPAVASVLNSCNPQTGPTVASATNSCSTPTEAPTIQPGVATNSQPQPLDSSANDADQGVCLVPDKTNAYLNGAPLQTGMDGGDSDGCVRDFESAVSSQAGEMTVGNHTYEESPRAIIFLSGQFPEKIGKAGCAAPADSIQVHTDCNSSHKAGDSMSAVHEDRTVHSGNGVVHLQDITLQVAFEEGCAALGFEILWYSEGLPSIGRVMPNGAADVRGMVSGDRLVECNRTSLVGKERDEVLQMLRVRPLLLEICRTGTKIDGPDSKM